MQGWTLQEWTMTEYSFIHSFIHFDSGGMAHKNNRQITIDNTRKYRKTDRHNNNNDRLTAFDPGQPG